MSLFAIADLHLSLGEDKPMDIFAGWNDYTERLRSNWNSIVTDNDTVVIAGDISWAMKLEETYIDFKFIDDLPGKKIFLKGNHDYWWGTKSKIDKFLSENSLTNPSTFSLSFTKVFTLIFLFYFLLVLRPVDYLHHIQSKRAWKHERTILHHVPTPL